MPLKAWTLKDFSVMRGVAFALGLALQGFAAADEISLQFRGDTQIMIEGSRAAVLQEAQDIQRGFAATANDLSRALQCQGQSCQLDIKPLLPVAYQRALGQTFAVAGPNCFATALAVTGLYPGFRGVDTEEMQKYTALFCREVQIPQPGDIGVYASPGYGFVHAFVYISQNLGLEKPGVDYAGRTAIQIRHLNSIDYRSRASMECRRFSPDLSLCSNDLLFFHCSQPTALTSGPTRLRLHQQQVVALEVQLTHLLENLQAPRTNTAILFELHSQLKNSETTLALEKPEIDPELYSFLEARLRSLEKQIAFLSGYPAQL